MTTSQKVLTRIDVSREISLADKSYGSFKSAHEGYGVLAEEVAELLDAIRANDRDGIEREAVQVAAVASRIAIACFDLGFRSRSGF